MRNKTRRRGLGFLAGLLLTGCSSYHTPYVAPATAPVPPSIAEQPHVRLVLIGDGGLPGAQRDRVLNALQAMVARYPDRTHTIFLGDNVYENGLKAGDREGEARLSVQVRAATAGGAKAIFVPGNHDWKAGHLEPAAAVVRKSGGSARWLPMPVGCPGPTVIDDLPALRLIVLDTDVLLRKAFPPSGCGGALSHETVADSLGRILLSTPERQHVIVVGHHPLRTEGRHATCRFVLCHKQDFRHAANAAMRRSIAVALEKRPVLMFAAGHDHSLQIFSGSTDRYAKVAIVSGSASKTTSTRRARDLLYGRAVSGFMVLDVMPDGAAWLRVVEVTRDSTNASTAVLLVPSGN